MFIVAKDLILLNLFFFCFNDPESLILILLNRFSHANTENQAETTEIFLHVSVSHALLISVFDLF